MRYPKSSVLFVCKHALKVIPNELESQAEFEGFSEWLDTFELYRGKKSEEEFEDESRVVGKFKVLFKTNCMKYLLKYFSGIYQSVQAPPTEGPR